MLYSKEFFTPRIIKPPVSTAIHLCWKSMTPRALAESSIRQTPLDLIVLNALNRNPISGSDTDNTTNEYNPAEDCQRFGTDVNSKRKPL